MIHPSTMAGPNWFTGSFGTTNPFQQNTSPFFRNPSFQGTQGGFGMGNNPFQNPFFGTNTTQIQNGINEIVRQTVPTVLASYGFSPTNGFQTPSGFQNPTGFQTPTGTTQFGTQFQTSPFTNFNPTFGDWQNPNFIAEMIRQATNQAMQNFTPSNTGTFFPGTTGQNTPYSGGTTSQQLQQNILNICGQICQQACLAVSQTTCQAIVNCATACLNQQNYAFNATNPLNANTQQNIWNSCGQICQQACQQACQTVCQSVIACANACLNTITQQNPSFNTSNTLFNSPNTPFNMGTTTPQYSFTSGIPTGVGAF